MKKLMLLALVVAGFMTGAYAQQDAMYTQFMFNKLAINPAYAGSREALSMTALYRHQWTQIPGAPRTGTFTIHSPLKNDKLALGLMVINDRLGVTNETGAWASYAYRIPIRGEKGRLSMGLQGGVSNYRVRLSDAIAVDPSDPALQNDENLWLPNFGFGVYYYSEKLFIGGSVPHLLNNKLTSRNTGLDEEAQKYRHYMAMAGVVFNLGSSLKARPSVLFKISESAPWQLDANLSFLIKEKLWLGATYRTSASVDFLVEYNLTPQLRIGYAYDYVLNEIGNYTKGSHEILFGYDFAFEKKKIVTPRNIIPRYF